MNQTAIIRKFYEIGALRFGSFQLKSGILSPIYIDLRLCMSYPELLQAMAGVLWEKTQHIAFDIICGVPLGAIPLATTLSLVSNKPMVLQRKEIKAHGTKKAIEGIFEEGQSCLIVEDLITTGTSIAETRNVLEGHGLVVNTGAVFVDREQGGKEKLKSLGVTMVEALSITQILTCLQEESLITSGEAQEVYDYIHGFSTSLSP